MQKTKRGAASIYTVVITCLLFGVISVGFVQIILRERKKSISNDLADSAYDSALAGVEDAKLALSEYYSCINDGYSSSSSSDHTIRGNYCRSTISLVEESYSNCDAVTKILGRNGGTPATSANGGEVLIREVVNGATDTIQAYTCVQISTVLNDYRSTLSSSSPTSVVPFYSSSNSHSFDNAKYVRVSWFSQDNLDSYNTNYRNYNRSTNSSTFPPLNATDSSSGSGYIPVPPTLSFSIFQTASQFTLSQLDDTGGLNATNRATVWLVPSKNSSNTTVTKSQLVQSNNHTASGTTNNPIVIGCDSSEAREFICTATLELPDVRPGPDNSPSRQSSGGSFFALLSLPYGTPDTDFSVELLDASGNLIPLDNVQVSVDSTGRANDVFSRVETRLEFRDTFFPFPDFAIEAGGGSSSGGLEKSLKIDGNCWAVINGELQNSDSAVIYDLCHVE